MNSINCLLLPLTLISASSCALFSSAPSFDNKKLEEYIQGSGFNRNDLTDIETNLTRNTKMAGDIYRVQVYPYTAPLIEALVDDQAAALSLTQEQRKTLSANLVEKYLSKKTCLQFHYQVARVSKVSQLKDWRLQIVDHYKNTFNTQWTQESLAAIPTKSFDYIGPTREPVWIGQGVACTHQKVDLSKDFNTKVIAQFAPFPFSKEDTLTWKYPVYKEVNGEKVEVEEKSEDYKGYRGW